MPECYWSLSTWKVLNPSGEHAPCQVLSGTKGISDPETVCLATRRRFAGIALTESYITTEPWFCAPETWFLSLYQVSMWLWSVIASARLNPLSHSSLTSEYPSTVAKASLSTRFDPPHPTLWCLITAMSMWFFSRGLIDLVWKTDVKRASMLGPE